LILKKRKIIRSGEYIKIPNCPKERDKILFCRKTLSIFVALFLATSLFLPAQILAAAPKRSSLSRLDQITKALSEKRQKAVSVKKQVDAIHQNLNRLVQEYSRAWDRLERTKAEIQENQTRLEAVQKELRKSQNILNQRASTIYRYGKIHFIAVILNIKTFREFLVRLDMLQEIARQDMIVLENIKKMEAEVKTRGEELERKKAEERAQVAYLRGKQVQIQAELLKEKALLAAAQKEVSQLEEQEKQERERLEKERRRLAQLRSASLTKSSVSPVRVDGFVFPVAGPHAYSDSWGDYRSGGRRHQGNDIFALKGTPAVAVVNGVIQSLETQVLGGLVLRLKGDNGDIYSYAHLNGYAPGISVGTRVRAGQTIAYVGNTGNASGGPDHLHFEIRPGGGAPVNPYPILRGAE